MFDDDSWVRILALLGWLALALGGLASYKLSFRKTVTMALIWAAIFTGVALFISLVHPQR